MKLGFGGEANWNSHLESRAHRENESKIIKSQSLTTWFKKSAAKPTKAAASLPTLMNKLPVSSSEVTAVAGNSLANHILQVVEFILPTFSWGNRMNSTSVAYHNPISVNLIVLIND